MTRILLFVIIFRWGCTDYSIDVLHPTSHSTEYAFSQRTDQKRAPQFIIVVIITIQVLLGLGPMVAMVKGNFWQELANQWITRINRAMFDLLARVGSITRWRG